MKLYCWRHSTAFSSWSMMEEPRLCKENYSQAEVIVLANSRVEAEQILAEDQSWDIDEIRRIEPTEIELDRPKVVSKLVS